jgi:hypothetical protein
MFLPTALLLKDFLSPRLLLKRGNPGFSPRLTLRKNFDAPRPNFAATLAAPLRQPLLSHSNSVLSRVISLSCSNLDTDFRSLLYVSILCAR